MGLTSAIKDSIWIKGLVSALGIPQEVAIVYYDSLSAIYLAKDQVHDDRTKYIDVSYQFILTRECWGRGPTDCLAHDNLFHYSVA